MSPSHNLSVLIASDQWDAVIAAVKSRPDLARQWTTRQGFFEGIKDSTVLPLHECLVAEQAPFKVTLAVLEAYTDAVRIQEGSYKRLPLHCACRRHANPAVVNLLLEHHADACLQPDALGRLPLHYALSNGAEQTVVQLLLRARPSAAQGVDDRGWTPLHVAVSMGAPVETVTAILKVYPAAVVLKTRKGSSVSRCLHKQCAHRQQLKELLTAARQDFDRTFVSPLDRQPSFDLMLV
jgi:hypothetical protein